MAERKFLFLNTTYGYHEEHNPASDTLALFGLTMGGNIALGTHKITGLGDPNDPQDAATKNYVDNIASGLMWKPPCVVLNMVSNADYSGSDPVGMAKGDCFVVNNWATQSDGDIVEWSGTAWVVIQANTGGFPADGTRVIIKASGAGGDFTGHEDTIATYAAGTDTWSFSTPEDGWAVLINGDGGIWSDTAWTYNGTSWVQFSGTGQINAGPGLYKDGNLIGVGNGDGIAIGADNISLDLATDPGLQLTGTSPDKKLSVLAYANGGVQVTANGVELKLDNTPDTLDVDVDGLKVVGLPSLFKINDSAVSANVTATNLNTLTAGSSSDASALHKHTAVDEAGRVEATHLNNVIVAAGQAVCWSTTPSEIGIADNSAAATARTIGVARTGGAANPGTSEVVKCGVCTGVLSGATVGDAYFLGATGALVLAASIPTPGQYVRVGYAVNATDLDIQIQDYGKKI